MGREKYVVVELPEFIVVGISIALLFGYHARLYLRIKRRPEKTAFGKHKIARSFWLDQYAGSKHDILVVQTLRNWIMSSTFLASTSILVALGLLGIVTTTDQLSGLSQELNLLGSADAKLLLAKFLLILLLFMTSFFAFTFSIRFITHAGFVANLPKELDTEAPFIQLHEDLEKGALCYFVGLRCLYLSVPVAMWLLGPVWLLAATVFLLGVLIRFD
jgi:uncharacterized membrane protein